VRGVGGRIRRQKEPGRGFVVHGGLRRAKGRRKVRKKSIRGAAR